MLSTGEDLELRPPDRRVQTLGVGERDKHFPLPHAERLHVAIEGSELEVLPGAEHWMAWHAADEVALRIRRFASAAAPGV